MRKATISDDTRLLRIPDAALKSGLGQIDLRRLTASGEVASIRRGRLVLVDYPDLDRWITEQAERSKAAV